MAQPVSIDDDLKERVRQLAADQHRTPTSIMREAIRTYVEKEEARSAFVNEARGSLKDYTESGLHLSGDEVDDWLKTWGTAEETDAPECHN